MTAASDSSSPWADREFVAAFWLRVRKPGKYECWPWNGDKESPNYGQVRWNGKVYSAHKMAFALAHKRWPEAGMKVCHKCDVKPCCNPRHLLEKTGRWNALDSVVKTPRPDRLVLWNLRLSPALIEQLKRRGLAEDRPVSWLVRRFIEEGLARKRSIT